MAVILEDPKIIKVRKEHICQGCGKKINIGERVTVTKLANDGTAYSFYECDECNKYFNDKCCGCKDFDYCIGENYPVGAIKECQEGG